MSIPFDIAIQNFEDKDIRGLTLMVRRSEVANDPFNKTQIFDIIQPSERIDTKLAVTVNLDTYFSELYNSDFIAIIVLNNQILDQRTYHVTERQF